MMAKEGLWLRIYVVCATKLILALSWYNTIDEKVIHTLANVFVYQ